MLHVSLLKLFSLVFFLYFRFEAAVLRILNFNIVYCSLRDKKKYNYKVCMLRKQHKIIKMNYQILQLCNVFFFSFNFNFSIFFSRIFFYFFITFFYHYYYYYQLYFYISEFNSSICSIRLATLQLLSKLIPLR